ncbi:MAG: SelT/SelW/SelH family protein [Fibrobacter sp.]|nr:SelT/SelW/SelH family protein [Fibrobacter sp.]
MAQEIKETFGYEAQLVKSSGGVFEIEKNGKLIFSKKKTGKFPEPGEIIKLLSK